MQAAMHHAMLVQVNGLIYQSHSTCLCIKNAHFTRKEAYSEI